MGVVALHAVIAGWHRRLSLCVPYLACEERIMTTDVLQGKVMTMYEVMGVGLQTQHSERASISEVQQKLRELRQSKEVTQELASGAGTPQARYALYAQVFPPGPWL